MQQDCDKVYVTRVGKLPILNPSNLSAAVIVHLTASMHDGKLTALMCAVDIKLVQLCWANLAGSSSTLSCSTTACIAGPLPLNLCLQLVCLQPAINRSEGEHCRKLAHFDLVVTPAWCRQQTCALKCMQRSSEQPNTVHAVSE